MSEVEIQNSIFERKLDFTMSSEKNYTTSTPQKESQQQDRFNTSDTSLSSIDESFEAKKLKEQEKENRNNMENHFHNVKKG